MTKSNSVLGRFGWSQVKKNQDQQFDETGCLKVWIHPANRLTENYVCYNAKFLGLIEVSKAKGVDVVKEAVKKLRISYQVKKSESGHKGSKLQKVEIHLNVESVNVVDAKTKAMICSRPLHRVSYCADDNGDKRLFAFIAKDQETKKHNCFAFICEKEEAAELTLSFGQAFQMAYKRYVEKEKKETETNNEYLKLEKQIEQMRTENERLKKELGEKSSNVEESNNVSTFIGTSQSSFIATFPSAPQTPLTPGSFAFQSLSNPYPTSPDITTPKQISSQTGASFFDAGFGTMETGKDDAFDPFSNVDVSTTVVASGNNNVMNNNCGSSLFPMDTYTSKTNTFDLFNNNFGTSPKDEDFQTKFDPFADAPDWQSVASEETINISSQNGGNPFGKFNNESYAVSNNTVGTEFNEGTDEENIGTESKGNFRDFGNDNSENDLFSRYLSNVVASRNVEFDCKAQAKQDKLFSDQPFPQFSGQHKTSLHLSSNLTQNSFTTNEYPDMFSNHYNTTITPNYTIDPLTISNTGTSDNSFQVDFNQLSLNRNNNAIVNTSDISGPVSNSHSESFRPRPSAHNKLRQGLRAPPTKQEIKAIKPPPTIVAVPRTKAVASTQQQQQQQQPAAPTQIFDDKILSSSHTLPNVVKGQNLDNLDLKSRSRTTSRQVIPPLHKSISQASKSLDDLVDQSKRRPYNSFTVDL